MPTLINSGKPFRIFCDGEKIKLPVGESKVSDKNLEKLNKSEFFKMLVSNDTIRISTAVKVKPVKDSKKKAKIVDLENDED